MSQPEHKKPLERSLRDDRLSSQRNAHRSIISSVVPYSDSDSNSSITDETGMYRGKVHLLIVTDTSKI